MPRKNLNLKKTVRKEIDTVLRRRLETKYHDFDITASPSILSGGINYFITNIADGTSVLERVGQKIRIKRVEIRARVDSQTAGTQPSQPVRLVLFRDMNEGQQTATISELLESGNFPTCQQLDWDNQSRFQVLYDRRFVVSPLDSSATRNVYINITRSMLASYNGIGANSSGKGRLTFSAISDVNTADDQPLFNFTARVWFEDA